MKFWHYTTYPAFLNILEERKIRTTWATASIGLLEGPRLVWFSTNDLWEQSVRKAIKSEIYEEKIKLLSMDELFRKGHYPVRLRTNERLSELMSWGRAKKQIGLTREHIKEIEGIANAWDSNIAEWWVCLEPVTMPQILLPVEMWNGRAWGDIEKFEFT
ncbi:MAG: hypothetical protein KKF30_13545 [Proteobacteria bacterium]|nr:hypothetical protein [Pseudomonadota bacterium]MBU4469908.1 hypothetical protein [Pseudomonadota bacterium]MCG2751594.1 hypothetical protein [Desulfobacteraceae bacterium]